MEREYGSCIIQIGDFLVSSEIVTEFFACDYASCRGACCVIGDSGAPLEEWEPEEIERNYPAFSPLMQEAGRAAVSRTGFFEIDPDGSLVTPLVSAADRRAARKAEQVRSSGGGQLSAQAGAASRVSGQSGLSGEAFSGGRVSGRPGSSADRECAFTCFDPDGSCFCSIERQWFAGKSTFRKPQSCHLYPIRVTHFPDGGTALNLHRWDICKAAFEKGRRENIRVYEFLEEPIRQYFGSEFYTALTQCAQYLL